MKLLIMVACLFLERYGEHFENIRRFSWFDKWAQFLQHAMPSLLLKKWGSLLLLLLAGLPVFVFLGWLHFTVGLWFWGLPGLILEAGIFFYCLGPQNLFQSPRFEPSDRDSFQPDIYFEQVNRQWFGVVFWYLVLGISGAVFYRLVDLAREKPIFESIASKILQYLDWIPARLTALLYLLVGNFQPAYAYFLGSWCSGIEQNQAVLAGCGLRALNQDKQGYPQRLEAQQLVWRASILCLVCVACLTLAAWLT